MTRINTNVSALVAQRNLSKANSDLKVRLERLATGLAINRGADNPAGLIVSERLRSEIQGVTAAVENAERAANVIATTEAALAEVATLLTSIKSLTIQAANTGAFSPEEIQANQLEIDSAVDSISRISNTASFAGLRVLNGGLDYITSGTVTSQFTDIKIFGANFGTDTFIPVSVDVLQSAQRAELFVSNGSAPIVSQLLSSVTFEVQGTNGVEVFEFVSGTNISAVAAGINRTSDATSVSASIIGGSAISINSTDFGTDAFVSVRKFAGGANFQTVDALGGAVVNRDIGDDVLALVNGNLALGKATTVTLKSSVLNVEINLTSGAAQSLTAGTPHTFAVTGGGATFQIGPTVNSSQQVGFGIQSVAASRLGNNIVGFLNTITSGGANSLVAGKPREAGEIIDEGIDQISKLRGRLGAFERNTLQTTVRSSQVALENLTSAESQVRDADFAIETALLTRAQILVNAGTSTLAIANSSSQAVLALLG